MKDGRERGDKRGKELESETEERQEGVRRGKGLRVSERQKEEGRTRKMGAQQYGREGRKIYEVMRNK